MISIIILCHNNIKLTINCIKSISKCELPPSTEIIIVDNSSEPPYPQNVFNKYNLNLKLIRNSSNFSFSKANNIASEIATGELILFLNNDVQLFSDTITQLIACFAESPNPSVVGGKLLYPLKNDVQHAGIFHMLWGVASNYGVGAPENHHDINFRRETDAVSGAMLLIQSTFFNKIGMFDEKFHWGYEDLDLCMKAKKCGASIIYEPKSQALHHESYTLKSSREYIRSINNYKAYRKKWDNILIPKENLFLDKKLFHENLKIGIYGKGMAAKSLFDFLHKNKIKVDAFIDSCPKETNDQIYNIPILSPEESLERGNELILIGSQYFYDIGKILNKYYERDMIVNPIL